MHLIFAPESKVEVSVAPSTSSESVTTFSRIHLPVVVTAKAVAEVMKCTENVTHGLLKNVTRLSLMCKKAAT
jgi:hypothetical protein